MHLVTRVRNMQTETPTASNHENPFFSAISAIDDLVAETRNGATGKLRKERRISLQEFGLPEIATWQLLLLFISDKEHDQAVHVCDCIDSAPAEKAPAVVRLLRESLVAKGPDRLDPNRKHEKISRFGQRFVVFMFVEMVRAADYSLDEAIESVSALTLKLDDIGYTSASTIRSWYRKSGIRYRGLKQLAVVLVAHWLKLGYQLIEFILDRVPRGFRLASELNKRGVISSDELKTMREYAQTILITTRDATECFKNAPSPNVNNGWSKLDIRTVMERVSPCFGE